MNALEIKTRLERGERVNHGLIIAYQIKRLNGHAPMSALCKAVYCHVFGQEVYVFPRRWQRYI